MVETVEKGPASPGTVEEYRGSQHPSRCHGRTLNEPVKCKLQALLHRMPGAWEKGHFTNTEDIQIHVDLDKLAA